MLTWFRDSQKKALIRVQMKIRHHEAENLPVYADYKKVTADSEEKFNASKKWLEDCDAQVAQVYKEFDPATKSGEAYFRHLRVSADLKLAADKIPFPPSELGSVAYMRDFIEALDGNLKALETKLNEEKANMMRSWW